MEDSFDDESLKAFYDIASAQDGIAAKDLAAHVSRLVRLRRPAGALADQRLARRLWKKFADEVIPALSEKDGKQYAPGSPVIRK